MAKRAKPTCRSCGAVIEWVRSERSGKWIPLDIDPVDEGTIQLDYQQSGARWAKFLNIEEAAELRAVDPDVELYVSHFATCPNADKHRKAA